MIEYFFTCQIDRKCVNTESWIDHGYSIYPISSTSQLSIVIFPVMKWQEEFISGWIYASFLNSDFTPGLMKRVCLGNSDWYKDGKFITIHDMGKTVFDALNNEAILIKRSNNKHIYEMQNRYKEKIRKLTKYKERLKSKIAKLEHNQKDKL